jgi:hypothetical protein
MKVKSLQEKGLVQLNHTRKDPFLRFQNKGFYRYFHQTHLFLATLNWYFVQVKQSDFQFSNRVEVPAPKRVQILNLAVGDELFNP